ncbi:MAG: leucine-rich repeat domain-containing protein [Clostridia bacterium]|nr:leucine-rich repeat domain-containing protein [Clostridia bacterium]
MNKIKKSIITALSCAVLLLFGAVLGGIAAQPKKAVKAETAETPTLTVVSNNLSYSESIYLLYAVGGSGFDRETDRIQMLFWEEPQAEYTYGTQKYVSTSTSIATVKGQSCVIFYSDGLAAKQMTLDVFARAYVEVDGVGYYSDVTKFSVLEYVYTIREKGGLSQVQIDFFKAMLDYGAAAQLMFNYKIDRLANATYYNIKTVNGVLKDGFPQGRYQMNEEITLRANPAPENCEFAAWVNTNGDIVSNDEVCVIATTGTETYTATYNEDAKGFLYTLSGGEYTVTGYEGADTDIVIPATYNGLPVTSIAASAFENKGSLTSVTIGDNVTTIGARAFFYCRGLTRVVLGNSVMNIADDAFEACYKLVEVGNKSSLTITAGSTANGFVANYAKAVYADSYSTKLSKDANGYGIYTDGAQKILMGYSGAETTLTLPEGITDVYKYAFLGWTNLTSVVVPNSVTSLGRDAFNGCTSLASVNIPSSVTSIEPYTFYNCSSLTSIEIPEGVTSIGELAFSKCSGLTGLEIPEEVTSIGVYAFRECNGLTSVVIPSNVTSVGEGAFYNCANLTIYCVAESKPDGWNDNWNLSNCPVVWACEGLTFSLSNGEYTVTNFSGNATGVVIIPKRYNGLPVTSIGNYAFEYCRGLTSVTIPNSVTSIGTGAFFDCSGLTSVVIPDSVTSIGDSAFYNCDSLTSVTIPDSVTSIGARVFENCSSIKDVYYTGDIASWCQISGLSSIMRYELRNKNLYIDNELIAGDLVIPDNVTSICDDAFSNCLGLTSVIIPESVMEIGDSAFRNCYSLTEVYNKSSLQLTAGKMDENHSYVSFYARAVYTDSYSSKLSTDANGYIIYTDGEEKILIRYTGKETDLVLPRDITQINHGAFFGSNTPTSVEISDSVTSIGYHAFYNCSSLTSVIIPDRVTSIGDEMFAHCYGLTSVTIPDSVTSIGDRAFNCCVSLTSVKIPDRVTSIGWEAFHGCTSLTSVVFGDGVTSIGEDAFNCCTSLTSVVFGDGVTSIGEGAFAFCDKLTSVVIPDSVTRVGDSAFSNCDSLTSVVIGNGVTSIGDWAFERCTSLTSIEFKGTMEQWYAIEKGSTWMYNVPAEKVVCSDGEVAL